MGVPRLPNGLALERQGCAILIPMLLWRIALRVNPPTTSCARSTLHRPLA